MQYPVFVHAVAETQQPPLRAQSVNRLSHERLKINKRHVNAPTSTPARIMARLLK
jgi:hypothetical protein